MKHLIKTKFAQSCYFWKFLAMQHIFNKYFYGIESDFVYGGKPVVQRVDVMKSHIDEEISTEMANEEECIDHVNSVEIPRE